MPLVFISNHYAPQLADELRAYWWWRACVRSCINVIMQWMRQQGRDVNARTLVHWPRTNHCIMTLNEYWNEINRSTYAMRWRVFNWWQLKMTLTTSALMKLYVFAIVAQYCIWDFAGSICAINTLSARIRFLFQF